MKNRYIKRIILGSLTTILAIAVIVGICVAVIAILSNKEMGPMANSDESDYALYDAFLSGQIGAMGHYEDGEEFTIYSSDLEIGGNDWDAYDVYGYLDVDNDERDELILQGPYGAYIFDANKKQVNIFAYGGGTANTLLLAYYDDAYWIVYSYMGADMYEYSMSKYKGADKLVDSFYYGWQTDENGDITYFRGDKNQVESSIEKEEFEELQNSIIPLYRDESENIDALLDENHPPISEEDIAAFQITCEADAALGFENFDDFNEILNASYIGTWYTPECNQAMRIFEDGCYLYFPALELYGDQLYEWEIVDRSDRGLCPMLEIYVNGKECSGFAFYICGKRENYFWCNSQASIFYKQ